jgi:uncharacterized tellurite resistance protein B-like protein
MTNAILNASAKAFALVCKADTRLTAKESERFREFASGVLGDESQVNAAWVEASAQAEAADDFSPLIDSIVAEKFSEDDKIAVLRAAQAALIADGQEHPQEVAAIDALAAALGIEGDH